MGKTSKRKIDMKRRKLCEKIIGTPVNSAFMNENIPSGVALAWTGSNTAYLVNLGRKTAKVYVKEGKFLMKRALLPLKIWVEKPETERDKYPGNAETSEILETPETLETTYDLDYLGEELEKNLLKGFGKDQYFD